MSIFHLVRCECYETCKQEFSFGTNTIASDFAPDTWITLFEGNPRGSEGWNFCSDVCLAQWLQRRGNAIVMPRLAEPQEQSACKARRFLLVDENANICEGIKWSDGRVSTEARTFSYADWEAFKAAHDGSGVQWIDQEVSE